MASTVTEKTQGRMSIYKDRIKCGLLEIFGNIFNSGLSKICVVVPQDDSVITENVETIVQAFQEQHCKCKKQINAEIVFCLRRNPEEIMKNVDRSIKCIKSTAITRRELSTVVKGMFVQPKVKTTILLKSLEEVRADCYAVAVSHDVNLKKGPVSCAVSEAAGPGLQNFIKSHVNTILRDGETAVFEPFQLKERGVQKLIFGNLPKWKDKSNSTVIERFVEDCLLRADSLGCSSVAFPALGTGNLLCPPRDVVEAMLDGIAKYAAETTFGNIANVFICVIDEVIYQLLTIEKTMREDKISNATRISKDVTVLQAYAGKVRYRVVKKEDLATMSSIRYLHVHFGPDSDSTVDNTVMDCPWKIRIGTGTNKDALRQAMKKVISKCETDKITSIIFFVHTGFEFSETDQIDIITESAVKESAKKNKDPYYLDDVIVVVEESTFDLFESTSRSGRGKSLVWKILPCSRNKSSTNFVIAGNKKEQVLIAKGKIQAMFQPKESGVSVEAEVSAQINPGIILYLKSLQNDFYGRWKEQVQQVYRIDIVEDEENIVTLRGTFENIMNIETYLEKDFPSFPTATPFPKNSQNVEVVKRDSKENKKSDQQNKKKGTTLCLHHFEFTTRKLKVIIQCKDITCVATDFIVSEVGTAISQRIAEKAGQSYKDVLKSTLDKELGHHEGRCIRTDPGSLNCREVIHVFCPQKSEEVTVEKLIQLSSSMLSCLKTADSQYGESVAIPFLCAEFWQMGLCVHEYFRALTEFNEPTLRQVYLVDSDVGKVNSAIMELTKSVEKSGNKIAHAASSMAIISNDKCIKLHVTTGNLSVVSSDAIVVVEDTSLSLSNDTAKQIYEHGGPKFQQTYEELRSRQHKISEVICVPYMNVKQVLIAFPPAWKKQDSVFSRQICTTVDNVFSNVSSLNDVKSIAMSCFYSGDETEVTRLCCGVMINQLVRCFADISTTLKEIHFIFPNSKDVSIILQEIMEKIPLEVKGGK